MPITSYDLQKRDRRFRGQRCFFLPCSLAYGGAQLPVFVKAHDCMEPNQALGKIVVLI
jgi:hypothetical protein